MSDSNGASLNFGKRGLKMGIIVNKNENRAYTNALQDAIDNGVLSSEDVLKEMLSFFAESEIEDFCKKNDLFGDLFGELFDEDDE